MLISERGGTPEIFFLKGGGGLILKEWPSFVGYKLLDTTQKMLEIKWDVFQFLRIIPKQFDSMVVNIREKILSYVVKEKVTENEMHVREKPFLSRSKIRQSFSG